MKPIGGFSFMWSSALSLKVRKHSKGKGWLRVVFFFCSITLSAELIRHRRKSISRVSCPNPLTVRIATVCRHWRLYQGRTSRLSRRGLECSSADVGSTYHIYRHRRRELRESGGEICKISSNTRESRGNELLFIMHSNARTSVALSMCMCRWVSSRPYQEVIKSALFGVSSPDISPLHGGEWRIFPGISLLPCVPLLFMICTRCISPQLGGRYFDELCL